MKISDFKKEYCIQIDNPIQYGEVFDYLRLKEMSYITNNCVSKHCDESIYPYFVYFGYSDGILYPLITNVKPTEQFRKTILFNEVELE